jgi:phosphate transport system ATP-binding protein
VLLDGDDIYRHGIRAQQVRVRIGMVFQKPNPFPAMSIRDNVLSGLKLAGSLLEPRRPGRAVAAAGRAVARGPRPLATRAARLSGGQQQRLCIARALAVQPNVLLMDEPCSALDPTSTRRIEETIAELRDEVTVVIVTHNMQQAQRVSERCAFFLAAENEPGRVVEWGATTKMFESPDDERTLAYVEGRFG